MRRDHLRNADAANIIATDSSPADVAQRKTAAHRMASDPHQTAITTNAAVMLFDRVPEVQLFQVVQIAPTTVRVRLLVAGKSQVSVVWPKVLRELQGFLGGNGLSEVQVGLAEEPPERSSGGKYREIIPLTPGVQS